MSVEWKSANKQNANDAGKVVDSVFPQKPPLKILFNHESFLKEAGMSTHLITEIRDWSLCHQPLCAG